MGKKSNGTPPPAPDYTAVAKQQGQANIDAAQANAQIGRVNQSNPYGNISWTQGPNNQWTATTTLAPEQAALLKQLQSGQSAALGDISSMQAPNYSGLPALQGNVAPQAMDRINPTDISTALPNTSFNAQNVSATPLPNQTVQQQTSIDMNGLPQLNQDYGAQRQQIQDTLYNKQTQMLDPQYQQEETAMRANLINSGLAPGTEAYDRAINDFYRQKQQDYGSARTNAILAGGQEQSRLNADALGAYGALFGSRLGAGQFGNAANLNAASFANNAAGTDFQNRMAAAGLNNAANLGAAEFGNTAALQGAGLQQQNFQNRFAATAANNQTALEQYQQQMGAANLANAVRQQGVNEANAAYQLPLSRYGALFGTNVNTGPAPEQFSSQSVAAPDLMNAAAANQKAAIDMFNYQAAQKKASNPWSNILGAAGNFFTGKWGEAGQQVGSLFGGTGVQYGGG